MEAKRINEYFGVMINGRMKTVLIDRKVMVFDNRNNTIGDSEKWMKYMIKVIMNLFNTGEWSYLGNDENFTPEEKEKVLTIKLD